jgi:hypothetical protein
MITTHMGRDHAVSAHQKCMITVGVSEHLGVIMQFRRGGGL